MFENEIFVSELFFATPVEWHQIRGAQMALTMKLISVAYDMDEDVQTQKNREKALEAKNKSEENDQQDNDQFQGNSKKLLRKRKFFEKKANKEPVKEEPPEEELILAKMPSIFEYFGYALCPGTTVFGPWVSYKEYMDIFKTPKWVRQSHYLYFLSNQSKIEFISRTLLGCSKSSFPWDSDSCS